MALKRFVSNGNLSTELKDFISISGNHLWFSSAFSRNAKISSSHHVFIYIDDEKYQIHFEFSTKNIEGALKLTRHHKNSESYHCSSVALLKKYSWIKAIAAIKEAKNRQFKPKRDGKRWVIELTPSFDENCKRSEASKIPSAVSGIYRYINTIQNEVVYIGKGEIKKRLNEPSRSDWIFDRVEYSIVKDLNEQSRWESHWLYKFQESFNRLPVYNMINGKKKKTS
jgi:hypothetical protein